MKELHVIARVSDSGHHLMVTVYRFGGRFPQGEKVRDIRVVGGGDLFSEPSDLEALIQKIFLSIQ